MPKSIEQQAKKALEASIESMDSDTEQRLIRIRQQALLQQSDTTSERFMYKGAIAAFSVVVVTLLMSSQMFNSEPSIDLQPLLAQNEILEDPELLEEIEFIYWLTQENEQALL